MAVAKLTSKFQITIPAEIRRKLCLQVGDNVQIELDGDKVVMRAIHGGHATQMRGLGKNIWTDLGGGESWLEQERKTWEAE